MPELAELVSEIQQANRFCGFCSDADDEERKLLRELARRRLEKCRDTLERAIKELS